MSVASPPVLPVKPRTIRLLGVSGYPHDPAAADLALARLQAGQHRIENLEAVQRRYLRFAGTDGERAADLNRLADPAQPLPEIALAIRGGYGATRILHGLDYAGLARRLHDAPIALVGHSDFTAIQMALYAKAGIKTFGGPMLCADFGAQTLNDFAMTQFWSTLTQPVSTLEVDEPQAQAQRVDVGGTLWGGNLTMLASLAGTPYMPLIDGGILFIEDVNEQPFRVERMLYQLHLAGILARQQALVLGQFTGGRPADYDNGFGLPAVVEQIRATIGIPVVTGLPFGHVPAIGTLPFGAHARLVASEHGFSLTVSGYPYLT